MKGAEREIYRVLTNEVDWQLCAFCKFAESDGCDAGPECKHPLWKISEREWELEPGEDCWGFRPQHSVSFITDIVGIVLERGWQSATWWEREDGDYSVAGIA